MECMHHDYCDGDHSAIEIPIGAPADREREVLEALAQNKPIPPREGHEQRFLARLRRKSKE